MGWKSFKKAFQNAFKDIKKKFFLNKEQNIPTVIDAQIQDLEEYELISTGAYGKVYKVQLADVDLEAAVKVIPLERDNEKQTKRLQEICILRKLQHENIVHYYGACLQEIEDSEEDKLWITMEYCGGGSLLDLLRKYHETSGRYLPEHWISYVSRKVLKGLTYLQEARIIHKDIKTENILFTEDGQVKIADFGSAVQLKEKEDKIKGCKGTVRFMAPEIYGCLRGYNDGYNMECDIWALGITILQMAEGEIPYSHVPNNKVLSLIYKLNPPTLDPLLWSEKLHTFLKWCLEKDPQKRGTAKDLLNHNFIQRKKNVKYAQTEIAMFITRPNLLEEIFASKSKGKQRKVKIVDPVKIANKAAVKIANEDAIKIANVDIVRSANEDAVKIANEDADKIASEAAVKIANEDAVKIANENTVKIANEDVVRIVNEAAVKIASQAAVKITNEDAVKIGNEDTVKIANEDVVRIVNEAADKIAGEAAVKITNKDTVKNANEDTDKIANEDIVKIAGEVALKIANEDAVKMANEDAVKIAKETVVKNDNKDIIKTANKDANKDNEFLKNLSTLAVEVGIFKAMLGNLKNLF